MCFCPQPLADQLVLERRDPPADVRVWDGLDKERPLLDAEALHLALSLVLLSQQQTQLPVAVQVDVGAAGLLGGLDADGEASGGGGDRVGPEVHDDGPRGVEPLQRALGAAEVHLLHVPGVAFMGQTAGGQTRKEKSVNHPFYKEVEFSPLFICLSVGLCFERLHENNRFQWKQFCVWNLVQLDWI